MRRALIIVCVTLGLVVPAVALAGDASEDGTLSIRYGRGRVQVGLGHGVVIGRLASGSIRVDDRVETDNTRIDFWGCEKMRDIGVNTMVCSGTSIRFRVIGDRYWMKILGRGVFLSAVGRGNVLLDGNGDADLGIRDGVYSFNGDPYKSLPDRPGTFPLAPPSAGN